MLITNGVLVTWEQSNRILENHALRIQDGLIADIGLEKELKLRYPDEETLDAGGKYVMPGNICAHTHFYGAYSRGLAIPGKPAQNFPEILNKLWWPLDKSLTLKDVRYSALLCLADAIKHGTTTLVDHHASPCAISGSLEEIAQAVDEAGVRACLCYEVTDRDGEAKAKEGIKENLRFIDWANQNREGNDKFAAAFGLHASLSLSDKTLDACRQACPDEVGFHVHAAEHPEDQFDSLAKSGMRVVDRLNAHGILGPKTIVAHAVHVDAKEIFTLVESGAWVTHQPRSNMNNAVGMAPVESQLRAGVKLCLGNDGFSNAMWEEWKAAYLAHKLWHLDPRRVSGFDVAQMAIYNNSQLATSLFNGAKIGVLETGARADLIIVDYHPYTPLTAGNIPWHILFGFHESMVTTTIVAGKVLMRDRELLTLDEGAIAAEAMRLYPGVWERYHQQFS